MKIYFVKVFQTMAVIVLMSSGSCGEDPFDAADGQRSFVSGRIENAAGEGIANFDVRITSFNDIIGVATTDNNGDFKAIVLDNLGGTTWLSVKPNERNYSQTDFYLRYRFSQAQNNRSYYIVPVQITDISNVEVTVNIATAIDEPMKIIYKKPSCNFEFQDGVERSSSCFGEENTYLVGDRTQTIQTPINTEVIIRATQNGITTDYTYIIDQNNYEILLTL